MALTADPNDFEEVDQGSAKLVGEIHLKKYVKYMGQYTQQLADIEGVLGSEQGHIWDQSLNPVCLQTFPEEKVALPQLIKTENKVLNKVLIALSALCVEINVLENEAVTEFYDPILFYGETASEDDEKQKEGEEQLGIGRMLPLLQKLSCFGQRCREVVKNVIQQLAALHNKSMPKVMDASHVHLTPVYEHLCNLLRVLVTIDQIILSNSMLTNHWTMYKMTIKSVHHNPSAYGVGQDQLKPLEKLVSHLEKKIINGQLTQFCFGQDFDDSGIPVAKNSCFTEEFSLNIKIIFVRLEPKLADPTQTEHHLQFVGLCALFTLHYLIFRNLDRKLFRQMWDSYKKLPCVTLAGHVTWFVDEYFADNLPKTCKAVDSKMPDQAVQSRGVWLSGKVQAIQRECQGYYASVNTWMVKMLSSPQQDASLEDLATQSKVYIEGYRLICGLRNTVETLLNLHVVTNKPMTVNEVTCLCRMVTMCKAVSDTFFRHSMRVSTCGMHIVQHQQFQVLTLLQVAKKRVTSDRKYSDRKLDMLSSIMICENCINGSPTTQRLVVTKLALSIANQSKMLRDDEHAALLSKFEKIQIFGSIGILRASRAASDQSAFYWHRALLTNYLEGLSQNPVDASSLHHMFAALEDCVVGMKRSKHLSSPQLLVDAYKEVVHRSLRHHLLDKICKEIENDLRLSVHTHLKLNDRNPFKSSIKSLRQLLSLEPLKFLGSFISPKDYVTHYLDQTFYNLTTVALHDWRTYGQMRNLAAQRYQLEMQEVHLPNQQLEQGLDVLEIMRNIHVFVSKYLYNLNNQIFVEQSSNNKHLNTINIRHIANSIRTHGTGIMNTTVNFTFQFLKQKFFIFSQFLFDEHIKSRLIKDMRHFRENREAYNQQYPYERADRFNRGIRKLGLSPDGSSFLDQFRLLISHIGNAMGYIRMVRSGGLHCCSNAISFVPDLEDIVCFGDLAKEEDISPEVNTAFAHLDAVLGSLVKHSAEGSDYLGMLVDVFAPEFRSSKNMHLRNFYAIIPPLTINFVEHTISCKEKMSKKNKVGASFTDDGFAMGLAYILKLLDQYTEFDSLHWFQSVRRKHADDIRQQANPAPKQSRKQGIQDEDEKLQQTRSLALKRINIYQREFELLYFSLSSARIFFRAEAAPKSDSTDTEVAKPTNEEPVDSKASSSPASTTA
uniref:WASH complex subunit 4 n=1 Tax=Ciona intestinalis TaxID=7719 RepID=UPI000180CF10|nr:WASH complex subunit 4 [Ciona intestinalis]|eukprot:XP_002122062.1 WASH complex subunit 4 [Ciona intestinalis]